MAAASFPQYPSVANAAPEAQQMFAEALGILEAAGLSSTQQNVYMLAAKIQDIGAILRGLKEYQAKGKLNQQSFSKFIAINSSELEEYVYVRFARQPDVPEIDPKRVVWIEMTSVPP